MSSLFPSTDLFLGSARGVHLKQRECWGVRLLVGSIFPFFPGSTPGICQLLFGNKSSCWANSQIRWLQESTVQELLNINMPTALRKSSGTWENLKAKHWLTAGGDYWKGKWKGTQGIAWYGLIRGSLWTRKGLLDTLPDAAVQKHG